VLRETFRVNRATFPAVDIVVQLVERPSPHSMSDVALSMWPRFVTAIGNENVRPA
jgi:hypothetical protein